MSPFPNWIVGNVFIELQTDRIQVLKQRQAREARAAARLQVREAICSSYFIEKDMSRYINNETLQQARDDSSGRSTPEHLKDVNIDSVECQGEASSHQPGKSRTFSETLNMLDDDILAELDVK